MLTHLINPVYEWSQSIAMTFMELFCLHSSSSANNLSTNTLMSSLLVKGWFVSTLVSSADFDKITILFIFKSNACVIAM